MKFKLLIMSLIMASMVAKATPAPLKSAIPGNRGAISDTAVPTQPQTPAPPKRAIPDYRGVVGDTAVLSKKSKKQEDSFLAFKYRLPPQPRDQWEVGLGLGPAFESANTRAQFGGGFAAYVRKSLGYTFSLRGRLGYNRDFGQDWEPSAALANNPVLKKLGYGTAKYPVFYYNYRANIYDVNLEGMITLNNIGFHKVAKDRKWNLYGIFGLGAMTYDVKYNALDKNGKPYDYSKVYKDYPGAALTDIKNRKGILKDLRSIMNGTYNTAAEGQSDEPRIGSRNYDFIVSGGLALGYHLSNHFTLTAEYRATNTRDRLLDGHRWQEHTTADPALANYEVYNMGSISVGYFIGRTKRRVQPLYWQNPMDDIYGTLNAIEQNQAEQLLDTDGDGVIDKFDLEPNTPKGATVDSHGRMLDSDKDGVPDYLDKEPFTAPGWFPVDKEGYGKNGPKFEYGKPPVPAGGSSKIGDWDFCTLTHLPDINFDLDRFYIKPEFYSGLHEIAMTLMACPNQKMVVTGYADARETQSYNLVLSYNRVMKVVDFLNTNYGISRDRFYIKFDGKNNPRIPGLPSNSWSPIYEPRQYVNRRVEFHWAKSGETGTSTPERPRSPSNAGRDY